MSTPSVPAASATGGTPIPSTSRARTALLGAVAVLLTVVILTPIALSSQELIRWAQAPTGLDLPMPWPVLVFLALDAAACVCVLLTVYCAWRGEPAGVFGVFVWCFAFGSAFANWRNATTLDAAPDARWFFPAMSIAGPALLEAVLRRVRRWVQLDAGRRGRQTPAFGWRRWTPGLGAFRDTYGSYRTALLLGIDTVDAAITAYHQLCPDGSLRVVTALRTRHAAESTGTPTTGRQRRDTHPLPVDLMRRIPVDPDAYQRWLTIWAELRADPDADLTALADRHHVSRRQAEFIRRAGEAHLLDSTTPPAHRLVELADAAAGSPDGPPSPATTR